MCPAQVHLQRLFRHLVPCNDDEGIVLILATDKGILRGKSYYGNPHPFPPPQVGRDKGRGKTCSSFVLVKEGDFRLLRYDKILNKIFAKSAEKIYQSVDGKKWDIYQSNQPIDFTGISDIIKRR